MSLNVRLVALPNTAMAEPLIAPPLGLLYLASAIRDEANVQIIDLNSYSNYSELCSELYGVDVVGFTVLSANYHIYYEIAERIKQIYPHIRIVVGGAHIDGVDYLVKKDSKSDTCFLGEGEVSFLDYITKFNEMKECVVLKYPLIEDLDTIKFPARDLLDFSAYTRTIGGKPATNIITSRGCVGKCVFCNQNLWGGKLRMHSPEYVLEEIDDIKAQTGIDRLFFLDDSFTINKKRLFKICKGLKDRGIVWRCGTRSDFVDYEMLKEMKECGCYAIYFGVESGSQKVLDTMKKGTTVEQNYNAVVTAKKAGLNVRIALMVGCPNETLDDVILTEKFAESVSEYIDDYIISTFVPIVGSPSFDSPDEFDIIIDKEEVYKNRFKNYFFRGYEEVSGSVMEYKNKSKAEIKEHRKHLEAFLNKNVKRDRKLTVK
jgi:anaerobic magnesium-protoporphyrin IX monomethyl ester cyclase